MRLKYHKTILEQQVFSSGLFGINVILLIKIIRNKVKQLSFTISD